MVRIFRAGEPCTPQGGLAASLVLPIKSDVEGKLRDKLADLQPEEAAVPALLRARPALA